MKDIENPKGESLLTIFNNNIKEIVNAINMLSNKIETLEIEIKSIKDDMKAFDEDIEILNTCIDEEAKNIDSDLGDDNNE